MHKRTLIALLILAALLAWPLPARAQEAGPVYIVQPGDTLGLIASRFNVTVADLMTANGLSDPNLIDVGQYLVIPGLEGIRGVLTTETVDFGDSWRSLLRRTRTSADTLSRLNRLISPSELYAGVNLIIPVAEGESPLQTRASLPPGGTLLETAIRQGSDPWTLATDNGLSGTWTALPGDVLYARGGAAQGTQVSGLPAIFSNVAVTGLPFKQGGTAVIRLWLNGQAELGGLLVDMPLRFFPDSDGSYVALQGVHALLDPGIYPLRLEARLPDGSSQSFEQMVLVVSGYYPQDPDLYVEPSTIDPAVTEPEYQRILDLVLNASPQKYWDQIFLNPASTYADVTYFTSRFGSRRTYYGIGTTDTIQGFHSGLDYHGGTGLQITAPAPGVVVLADLMTVRGFATIIDHGWGIYSGIWHQSQINVQVGQMVQRGDVIGLVGETGRVSGPHLHWEVWVNGVQVDPLDWLQQEYP